MGLIKRVIRQKAGTPARRAARQQARRVSVKCKTCGKRYVNPLTHVCAPKSDFAKRRREAERAARREAARARKKAAAERRKAAAAERHRKAREKRSAPRSPRPQHDYRLCRDEDCQRYACVAYKDGVADCPLEHV